MIAADDTLTAIRMQHMLQRAHDHLTLKGAMDIKTGSSLWQAMVVEIATSALRAQGVDAKGYADTCLDPDSQTSLVWCLRSGSVQVGVYGGVGREAIFQAHATAQGWEYVEGVHCDEDYQALLYQGVMQAMDKSAQALVNACAREIIAQDQALDLDTQTPLSNPTRGQRRM